MRGVIRLNDPTNHGGAVTSASSTSQVLGIGVARVGDTVSCPKKGHRNCTIVQGDPDVVIDGVPVAFDGHMISCGATLISTMPSSGRT
jgi:uncharacterized Zn-binding protein involved in type VI secretion